MAGDLLLWYMQIYVCLQLGCCSLIDGEINRSRNFGSPFSDSNIELDAGHAKVEFHDITRTCS